MQTASHLHLSLYFPNRRHNIKPNERIEKQTPHSYKLIREFCFSGRSRTCKFLMLVPPTRLFATANTDHGWPAAPMLEEDINTGKEPNSVAGTLLRKWSPPSYLCRGFSIVTLAGQVIIRTLKGKIHWRNTLQQLERVGPKSVSVCLLTSAFVGMAFTNRSVGGVLALAFSRELSPVITSIVVAGRIGSAFAAKLGTMPVSEQTDTLRVLGAEPVDYLVTPRVIASCIALPFLTLLCFTVGMASSAQIADSVYGISINLIFDSAQRALKSWDIISAMIESQVFGAIISIVSCAGELPPWEVLKVLGSLQLRLWLSHFLVSLLLTLHYLTVAS